MPSTKERGFLEYCDEILAADIWNAKGASSEQEY